MPVGVESSMFSRTIPAGTGATGKKGRPLTCLQFLAAEADFPRLADWFLRHSTTFGLRHRPWDRLKLDRRFETRPGPGGPVTHKIGLTTAGEELKSKPEFEEVRRRRENPPGGAGV